MLSYNCVPGAYFSPKCLRYSLLVIPPAPRLHDGLSPHPDACLYVARRARRTAGRQVRTLDGLAAHGLPALGDGGFPVRPRARARPWFSRAGFPAPTARPLDGTNARPWPGVRRRLARRPESAPPLRPAACVVRTGLAERPWLARSRDRLRLRARHDSPALGRPDGLPSAHPPAGRSPQHPPPPRTRRPRRSRAPRESGLVQRSRRCLPLTPRAAATAAPPS